MHPPLNLPCWLYYYTSPILVDRRLVNSRRMLYIQDNQHHARFLYPKRELHARCLLVWRYLSIACNATGIFDKFNAGILDPGPVRLTRDVCYLPMYTVHEKLPYLKHDDGTHHPSTTYWCSTSICMLRNCHCRWHQQNVSSHWASNIRPWSSLVCMESWPRWISQRVLDDSLAILYLLALRKKE